MNEQARALLLKAADVQETNGLHQGGYYDRRQAAQELLDMRKCRVCALGAIATAAGLFPNEIMSGFPGASTARQAAGLLAAYLIEHNLAIPSEEGPLPVVGTNWADRPGQTAAGVASVMRAAVRDIR
ncbi:hypothetical protein ABT158_48770 [Nonomuraea sp. NPDC001636]|uniref:DUF6197 family protein n=1 Tax=Nonomuraea sp. NPDC001636 TaxID=3154391 RepID=UPI0033336309